ncbi:hypothetical protein Fmac_032278 [Flemingia macrophylla]|uniref:EGF-like domain-containing protein n=1 Tax=Flemingia macrophylla TaxID=520843 RepID=A0ABD1L4G7_9FABA
MKNITIQASSFTNFKSSYGFNNCSYAFVVKNGNYTFSLDHLKGLSFKKALLVVDWTIGNDTCNNSKPTPDYACKNNSYCEDFNTGYGYRCRCKAGFHGNPYLLDGCRANKTVSTPMDPTTAFVQKGNPEMEKREKGAVIKMQLPKLS